MLQQIAGEVKKSALGCLMNKVANLIVIGAQNEVLGFQASTMLAKPLICN